MSALWKEVVDFKNPEYPTSITDTNFVGILERAKNVVTNPSKADLRFDGKVDHVTGAAGGLGRAYALMFSKVLLYFHFKSQRLYSWEHLLW